MGGNEGGRGSDRWNLFGVRPTVQKSPTDPGSDSNTSGEKQPVDEPLTFILFVLAGKLLSKVIRLCVLEFFYCQTLFP